MFRFLQTRNEDCLSGGMDFSNVICMHSEYT